jgi:hypothetical protein
MKEAISVRTVCQKVVKNLGSNAIEGMRAP